jgi:hypothetical protein
VSSTRPDALLAREREVRVEVRPEPVATGVVVQEGERREVRQVEPFLEDQRRLHAPVGDEGAGRELWQGVAVYHD